MSKTSVGLTTIIDALNTASVIVGVLCNRVQNGLPIRPTQWATLETRVGEWRQALAMPLAEGDRVPRVHLRKIAGIVEGLVIEHRKGLYTGTSIWTELSVFAFDADMYLETTPFRRRRRKRAGRDFDPE